MRISDWSSDVCSSDLAWDAVSPFDGPEARASFTSLLFAPAAYTARWQRVGDLAPGIAGVSAAVFADDGQEAQGIALMMRHALETGERSEEHTSELQSLMRTSYAVFCLKKKKNIT